MMFFKNWVKKAEVVEELEQIMSDFTRTVTTKKRPLDTEKFDEEDSWNKAMEFAVSEVSEYKERLEGKEWDFLERK